MNDDMNEISKELKQEIFDIQQSFLFDTHSKALFMEFKNGLCGIKLNGNAIVFTEKQKEWLLNALTRN